MKKIEAIIRTDKIENLKDALAKTHYAKGMTVSQVLGHGSQQGFVEYVRGQRVVPMLLSKVKAEIVVQDKDVEQLIDLICDAVGTGEIGDGKIFIIPIDDAIRIRTKERGADALN